MSGKVYLIGAGPGDPGLITIKGLECIKNADVVLYDRLVSKKIISYAREGAEIIFVGKSPERHTLTQEEISSLLLQKAREGKTVARIKGGDPFVFGRGGEEAFYLAENGVPFEIVPGVTSAVAVPAYAGIPVTDRRYASSFAVITGNEDPQKERNRQNETTEKKNIHAHLSADSDLLTGAGTLIFLMGMANLPSIVETLILSGRSPKTPVAVIQWGSTAGQRTLCGNLLDIVEKAKAANFKNPAVIVVGEVVKLRNKLNWFEKKPLFGKRVLVTRSRHQASKLSKAIEELGGEPVEFPVIKIVPPEDYTPLDKAIEYLRCYSWIIFTSENGVESFFKRLLEKGKDVRELCGIKLCAIGPKTASALEKKGLKADYVPEEYRAEKVVEGLKDKISPGQSVLLPRADIARKVLPDRLKDLGVEVHEVHAYRTVQGEGDADYITDLLRAGKIDIVTFTSSSTVRNLENMLAVHNAKDLFSEVTVACIGPVTAATAREYGMQVDIEAEEYTINGLVEAIINYIRNGCR